MARESSTFLLPTGGNVMTIQNQSDYGYSTGAVSMRCRACGSYEMDCCDGTIKFKIGVTYSVRSLGDYDCIHSFTILDRTSKSVTVNVHGKTVRRGLRTYEGVEKF